MNYLKWLCMKTVFCAPEFVFTWENFTRNSSLYVLWTLIQQFGLNLEEKWGAGKGAHNYGRFLECGRFYESSSMVDCGFVPLALKERCVSPALEADHCSNFLQCKSGEEGEKSSPFQIQNKNVVCLFGAVTHKISIDSSRHWEIPSSVSKEFIAIWSS